MAGAQVEGELRTKGQREGERESNCNLPQQ